MENAQLISLSRQIALQRQMDVVANNMANINTTGFKSESLLFEDYLMPVAKDNDFSGSDRTLHYTQDRASFHDMTGGAIEQTENPLDVALNGPGFLSVQTPAGERYTRDGSLQINSAGLLVDASGNAVLGEGGPIQFDQSDTDISIGKNGAVMTSNGQKGKLKVSEFVNPQVLVREGDNTYSGPAGTPATGTTVVQGAIERSNVSGMQEMTNLIRVQRAYEQLANLSQRQDELQRGAIQKLGEMSA